MNIKKLLHFVWILVIGQVLFSCSTAEYYKFAPVKGEAYSKAQPKPAPETQAVEQEAVVTEAPAALVEEPVLEASAATTPVLLEKKHFAKPAVAAPVKPTAQVEASAVTKEEAVALVKERLNNMTKVEKKTFAEEVKTAVREGQASVNIVEVIFAILLPPLGVYLHEGELNSRFWISVLLTILFFLPGVIYALLVVTDSI